MSDCNHEKIKCMVCHRYVGVSDQVVPTAAAIARIKELEGIVEDLQLELMQYERKTPPPISRGKGYPGCLIEGKQHEAS